MTHRQVAIYNLGIAISHLQKYDHESLAYAEFYVALALLEMTKADPHRISCDMLLAALEQKKRRNDDKQGIEET
jgi:hypothetical protein